MKFDLSTTPATAAELDAEAQKIRQKLVIHKSTSGLWGLACLGSLCLSFVFFVLVKSGLLAALSSFVFALALGTTMIRTQSGRAIEDELIGFTPIPVGLAAEALKLVNTYPQLAAYQNQVAQTGRLLVRGEFSSMKEYAAQYEDKLAFESLKAPVWSNTP
jgi:hypothetical protein